jgi:hypothetical protein
MEQIFLGTGKFGWMRSERICDRYGYVNLWLPMDKTTKFPEEAEVHLGTKGKLVVLIKETRKSGHIGDIFHDTGPTSPKVGEEITIGEGLLSTESHPEGRISIGLEPEDGREHFWLDVPMLYRAHDQTVDLFFVPELETDNANT